MAAAAEHDEEMSWTFWPFRWLPSGEDCSQAKEGSIGEQEEESNCDQHISLGGSEVPEAGDVDE